jgi:hypothetical protein
MASPLTILTTLILDHLTLSFIALILLTTFLIHTLSTRHSNSNSTTNSPKTHNTPTAFPTASLPGKDPQTSYLYEGTATILHGLKAYNSKPFQILSPSCADPRIVLPPKYADEVKTGAHLSFNEALGADFAFANDTWLGKKIAGGYSEFQPFREAFRDGSLVVKAITARLTPGLEGILGDLVEETGFALPLLLGDGPEWREVKMKGAIADLVARVSSRVFLGRLVCREERWLEIAKRNAEDGFIAAAMLKRYPGWARPVAKW